MSTWSSPEIEVTIAGKTRSGTVARMDLFASRKNPVATLDLRLSNQRSEWTGLVARDAAISVRWGYQGFSGTTPQALAPIFDGIIHTAHEDNIVLMGARDRGVLLLQEITGKSYSRMAANAIVNDLVKDLGFATLDVDDAAGSETLVEVLPLHHETTADAIRFINQAVLPAYDFWCDAEGGFHWGPVDETTDPVLSLSVYKDVIEYAPQHDDYYTAMIQGANVWHSVIVEIENWQYGKDRHFVEGVRHTVGVRGAGTRTILYLRKLAA